MLIDSHCHLDFDVFEPEFDDIIERARLASVEKIITISTHVARLQRLLDIAGRYGHIYCSVGTHPNSAHEEPDVTAEQLVKLSAHPKVVAIGEAGLDYHYDYSTPAQQKKSFLEHISAARETQLPLVIHARNADDDMEDILRQESRKGTFPFILHCYSSGKKLAQAGIELGGYISFSGILTFKSAPEIREIAQHVPHDRLLVETDAPFLAPVPYRGETNEPAYVVETAKMLAKTLDVDFSYVAQKTTSNALRLFAKIERE